MVRPHRFLAAGADAVGLPAAFPLRVAAVDMGSNAIRFEVAEFASPRRWTVLASERRAVRLGHGVFLSGRLAAPAMDAAVEALASFVAAMKELRVEHCRAIATSAVREAANGEEFLARVREATGLQLETVSGAEEARLAYLAVRSRMSLTPGCWLIADLGGGSVEVSLVDADGILWSESHTIGAVRLLEELSQAGAEPGRFRQLLEEYVSNLRLPAAARAQRVQGFVATGGNIEALALGRRYHIDEAHAGKVAEVALALFDQLAELHGLGGAERRVLLAAALLHEVGQYVSFKGHHKHSLYLLHHSELAGFSPRQMQLVANVARYHRKTEPSLAHWSYASLSARERGIVDRLAALLRIADSLDREHLQRLRRVEARLSGKDLVLHLQGDGDLMLECWALQAKAGLFARVFGLRVRVKD